MKQVLIILILLDIHAFAQISGTVTDNQGLAIENALISHKGDPYVYTKSDADGNFTITGANGSTLTIAALHYTTQTVTVTDATNTNVQLLTDTLLDTDIYHISFDHMRPGAAYGKEELKDDFPVGYGKGFLENDDPATDRAFIDPTMDFSGDGRSIKVTYPAGQVKTANSGVDTRIPLEGLFNNNTFAADELYLSYWMRFSDNFDMDACGGKLPSLGGSNAYERENEWKGRIMWGVGGSIRFYMELPHDADGIDADSIRFLGEKIVDGGDICSNRFTPYLTNTQWHQIELHYVLEQNGQPGLFEIWVDGDKGHKILDSEEFGLYRRPGEGMDNLTINAILLSTFLGGGDGWEQDETVYAWFDEFRVSTQRIGSAAGPVPKPELVPQTIELSAGWNLVSLYVEPENTSPHEVFPNAAFIKDAEKFSAADGASDIPGLTGNRPAYLNSLTEIETGKGYMVYNTIDEFLIINGKQVSSNSPSVTHHSGWNIVAVSHSVSTEEYLNTHGGTIAKDSNNYYHSTSQTGTLPQLIPGKAYFIFID